VLTLKEKNKELKKLENFKKKIEDRYREKVKQLKDTQKDKTLLEDVLKTILPSIKLTDESGKIIIETE
jgi:hypothetical protein